MIVDISVDVDVDVTVVGVWCTWGHCRGNTNVFTTFYTYFIIITKWWDAICIVFI